MDSPTARVDDGTALLKEDEEKSDGPSNKHSVLFQIGLAVLIGLAWAASAQFTSLLQISEGYRKPVFIVYSHAVALMVICTVALVWPFLRVHRRLCDAREVPKISAFATIETCANLSFTAALALTSAPSALSLEQLTSILIGLLSWWLFKEQFPIPKLLGFAMAVGGNVVVVWADASGVSRGSNPFLGDMLVICGVCTCAAMYMVGLKKVYPSFTLPDLMQFFRIKGLVVSVCGLPLLVICHYAGLEHFEWPATTNAWWYFLGSSAFSVAFNLALNWAVLAFSPLSARLSILLGLPFAFVVDVATGERFSALRLIGIFIVVLGLVCFEYSSVQAQRQKARDKALEEIRAEAGCEATPIRKRLSI